MLLYIVKYTESEYDIPKNNLLYKIHPTCQNTFKKPDVRTNRFVFCKKKKQNEMCNPIYVIFVYFVIFYFDIYYIYTYRGTGIIYFHPLCIFTHWRG